MTPCREWQGARCPDGYGHRRAGGRFGTVLVHRQVLIMAGHDIKGKVVRHLCDNPACFRYDHLVIGTQIENIADMDAKGRRGTNKGQRSEIVHGTTAGYRKHHSYGIPPCESCLEAQRVYRRERYWLRSYG